MVWLIIAGTLLAIAAAQSNRGGESGVGSGPNGGNAAIVIGVLAILGWLLVAASGR